MAHLLKRLELNGFKSFAQKTVLEFPDGITAIVGPNGSGKSNVIDAIRWLLGEREARNLRGGTVEDLIFAGNHKRARLGLARASLHLDNREGIFPLEFPEVSVLREVARDGTSRYFLNQSEVRLKDIVDFFAKARLGTRGLVVVTQGNSDIFVQSDPRVRQEMIEEILGLREYQIKKMDAERRLANAKINLEKVRALIEEILPHLRSLKRQTNRWEKKEIFEQELHESENHFFGYQLKKLERGITDIEREIAEHRKEFEAFEEERKKAEAVLHEIEAHRPKEREDLLSVRIHTEDLLKRRSELQKEIGKLEAHMEFTKNAPQSSHLSSPALLELLTKVKRTLEEAMEKGAEDLLRTVKNLLEEIGQALKNNPPLQDIPADLESRFKKIQNDLVELEEELGVLKESENSLDTHREEFYKNFKEALAHLEVVKSKIGDWESRNQERKFSRERLLLHRRNLKIIRALKC